MKEILTINLENEMDLILAHKRAMKLAEMCNMSLPVQTIFATAVSEIARLAIERGKAARLTLGLVFLNRNKKQLSAIISDETAFCSAGSEPVTYARRLVDDVVFKQSPAATSVSISQDLPFPNLLSETKIPAFITYFEKEVPLSPYDELRRKNIQLQDLAFRLYESESNYRQMTDSLPLMMFSLDAAGHVTYVNKWLKEFLGFENTQLQSTLFQPFIHPEEYGAIYNGWLKAQKKSTALSGQARLKHLDTGTYIWHLLSIIPLQSEGNAPEVWNGFLVDIHAQKMIEQTLQDNSELKVIQQQLTEYQSELENKIAALNRSNHDLEQFAYIASHDLQEPLRKIRVFAELLQRHSHDKTAVQKYYARIDHSAARMVLLIKGVLDYSRISDFSDNDFELVDLNQTLRQVETDFEEMIRQKEAVLIYSPLPTIPGIALQLQQLFANLLSNSLKFSTATPVIQIAAQILSPAETEDLPLLKRQQDYIKITFQDNGIGFEQEYAHKIFQIFQQLNRRVEFEGTGIGLAICKKVVERHQGLIMASSQVGEGTVFTIILPANQS